MTETHLVYTCAHAKPGLNNHRAELLGKLAYDLRPDKIINLGDLWDMRSLNTYETRYPKAVVAQNYERDIDVGNDFCEKVKHPFVKNKVRQPTWIFFEGNHEHRIQRAIAHDPQLEGARYGVSMSHLNLSQWFNETHLYEDSSPALRDYNGITYGHFLATGAYGNAMDGEHHAHSMLKKRGHSTTVGHSHKLNFYYKGDKHPRPVLGLVAGCFKGKREHWAGQANDEWWSGVVIKRRVEDGVYDPEFVSLKRLEEEYG